MNNCSAKGARRVTNRTIHSNVVWIRWYGEIPGKMREWHSEFRAMRPHFATMRIVARAGAVLHRLLVGGRHAQKCCTSGDAAARAASWRDTLNQRGGAFFVFSLRHTKAAAGVGTLRRNVIRTQTGETERRQRTERREAKTRSAG